jgi:hypothetical protein
VKLVSTIALVLAGLLFAFTVYIGVWNNSHHAGRSRCDESYRYSSEQGCAAETEDKNLMWVGGAAAVGLLALGLVTRYQPGRGRSQDNSSHPPAADK